MRRLPFLRSLVLRFAVRLLLTLVLCLNGFLAPVAMAAHADMANATAEKAAIAQKAPPCHGDDTSADAATPDRSGHDTSPSCCKPGHCVCACVFSLSLPLNAIGLSAAGSQSVPLPHAVALRPARTAVPLRPPIA